MFFPIGIRGEGVIFVFVFCGLCVCVYGAREEEEGGEGEVEVGSGGRLDLSWALCNETPHTKVPFRGRGGFWRTSSLRRVGFDHRTLAEDFDSVCV